MSDLLLDVAIKGTVVLFATGLLARALRDRSAAVRHLVWSVALASLVVLPLLSVGLPAWRVTVLPVESVVASPTAAGPPVEGMPWGPIGVLAWLAGASLVIAVTAIGRIRLAWMARGSETLDDGPWPALANRISGEIGVGRRVRLRMIERRVMPMVCGVLRPVVLLPASAEGWSGTLRRHVLLHELIHVKRHDCLVQIVSRFALAIHWFNPLAWLAARHLRLERERACDDHVLECGADPCDYAEDLVGMARRLQPSAPSALALGMADPSRFGERVIALLEPGRPRGGPSRGTALVACLLAAGLVVPLAAMRPAAKKPASDPARFAAAVPAPPGATPAANANASADPDVDAGPAGARRPLPPGSARPGAESDPALRAPVVEVDAVEVTFERRGTARGVVEANTSEGIPRPGIARVQYRSSFGAGEAPSWTSTSKNASDTCEETDRGAPARPAQLASTTPETATP